MTNSCYCHTLLTSEGQCEYCFVSNLTPEERRDIIQLAVEKAVRARCPTTVSGWGGVGRALQAIGYDKASFVGLSFQREINHQFRQLTIGG